MTKDRFQRLMRLGYVLVAAVWVYVLSYVFELGMRYFN